MTVQPLLGTVVEVAVTGGSEAQASRVGQRIVAEMDRLEQVFSAFRDDSELNRWKRGEGQPVSGDLCEVMTAAAAWQQLSGGAFNPLVGELSALWAAGERIGRVPSDAELAVVAASIREPRFEMRGDVPVRLGDCSQMNLNAIAKGYIVDRALGAAPDVEAVVSILVSAGGDMAHRGDQPARIGIEHPLRPYDNEPPLAFVQLHNAALATSGGARRGFRIGGRRYSHVLDPRTGQPVDTHASISVIAPTAMEADVLTTVLGALTPHAAVEQLDERDDGGCLIIDPSGKLVMDSTWAALAVS